MSKQTIKKIKLQLIKINSNKKLQAKLTKKLLLFNKKIIIKIITVSIQQKLVHKIENHTRLILTLIKNLMNLKILDTNQTLLLIRNKINI